MKRAKETPIDRLSELPESLIIHTLSFLEVKQSAKTAVLSRRWRYLWIESPSLVFKDRDTVYRPADKFCNFVNIALVTRSRAPLEALSVDFNYTRTLLHYLNAWVRFAVHNKVKRVGFLLSFSSDSCALPQLMCSNSSLERLDIKGCTIVSQTTINWPSLSRLHIKEVKVKEHIIAKILSGCLVLSELTLHECWGFDSLEIKSRTLHHIGIFDCDYRDNGHLLQISAPYIKSLSVALYPERRKLCLTNIPSNATATIDFIGPDHLHSMEVRCNAKEILRNIHHVKAVELGGNYIEVLSCMAIEFGSEFHQYTSEFPQSTSRMSLKVCVDRGELGNIHGILGLLESSPNLEELVIQGEDSDKDPYYCPAAKGDLEGDLLHLKTVIIKDFVSPNPTGEPMLILTRILLKRAPVLEKFVIYVKEITKSTPAHDQILETLMNYPRSSQKASILIR